MPLLLKAFILGVVEGITEFLPISSTGHLIIASAIVDYPAAQRETFEIFIQLGATLAVVWHYRVALLDLIRRVPSDAPARALILKVGLAFLPAAVIGFLFHGPIERYLFSPVHVAAALVIGGLIILVVERRVRRAVVTTLEATRWADAAWIGIAQVASLYPGISRAGATIIGGLLSGLSRRTATEFSFYLALPTLIAASLYSLIKSLDELSASDIAPFTVGLVAAFVSALLVIRSFLAYVQAHDFRVFGYYRIAAGIVVLLVTQLA
jgi:undecaprenyl-diphosphatase